MVKDFLNNELFGNRIIQYVTFILISLVISGFLFIIKRVLVNRLKQKYGKKGKNIQAFGFLSERVLIPLILFIALYLSTTILYIPENARKVINTVFDCSICFFAIRAVLYFLDEVISRGVEKGEDLGNNKQKIRIISTSLKAVVWVIAGFLLLDNIGINITSLITGLGIGGIAVALAAQTILGDLFSCFIIYFDKPFEIGDYITIDTYSGTVEYIGLKTTRIRSLSGEQLVFPNSSLTTSRIRNYKRMEKRRVSFTISVIYEIDATVLAKIPGMIADIINGIDGTEFQRAHFSSYGDYGLIFEVVYLVTSNDYMKYMDIQQVINMKIKEEFEKNRIEFAYPTQVLYVNHTGTVSNND